MDESGERRPDIDLRLIDQKGKAVAEFETNARAEFSFNFSTLQPGRYRIETATPGWKSFIADVEITKVRTKHAKDWLQVGLGFGFECDSGVAWGKPLH